MKKFLKEGKIDQNSYNIQSYFKTEGEKKKKIFYNRQSKVHQYLKIIAEFLVLDLNSKNFFDKISVKYKEKGNKEILEEDNLKEELEENKFYFAQKEFAQGVQHYVCRSGNILLIYKFNNEILQIPIGKNTLLDIAILFKLKKLREENFFKIINEYIKKHKENPRLKHMRENKNKEELKEKVIEKIKDYCEELPEEKTKIKEAHNKRKVEYFLDYFNNFKEEKFSREQYLNAFNHISERLKPQILKEFADKFFKKQENKKQLKHWINEKKSNKDTHLNYMIGKIIEEKKRFFEGEKDYPKLDNKKLLRHLNIYHTANKGIGKNKFYLKRINFSRNFFIKKIYKKSKKKGEELLKDFKKLFDNNWGSLNLERNNEKLNLRAINKNFKPYFIYLTIKTFLRNSGLEKKLIEKNWQTFFKNLKSDGKNKNPIFINLVVDTNKKKVVEIDWESRHKTYSLLCESSFLETYFKSSIKFNQSKEIKIEDILSEKEKYKKRQKTIISYCFSMEEKVLKSPKGKGLKEQEGEKYIEFKKTVSASLIEEKEDREFIQETRNLALHNKYISEEDFKKI